MAEGLLTDDQRIDELLSRLSLEQKVGQVTMAERQWVTPADARRYGLGSVLSGGGSHPGDNSPADWVRMNGAFWDAMMDGADAPGIPILFGIDAVHGHNNVRGATVFPHNIGLGAAGSAELIGRIATITAREILATGVEWNFAPTLAVVQNPQWGRTYESFGSDPDRAAAFGKAYIEALQNEGVMGCVKHWVGDGGTRHGIDQGDTAVSWEELEQVHIAPYLPALAAGALSVMVSFNSWNGGKCHGSEFLVTTLLKERLGFDGIVVSDWDGIDYLSSDFDSAVMMAVNAGLDMFMVPERWPTFIETLTRQVERGNVSQARLDDAVRRVLRGKAALGLLDGVRPSERPDSNSRDFGSTGHRAVAREAVARSLVLLKNDNELLPLSPSQSVLVAGRSAHNLGHQCGGWTVSWQGDPGNDAVVGTTIFDAINASAAKVQLSVELDGAEADPELHDVAVVVVGETPYAEGFGDVRSTDDVIVQAGSMIDGLMKPLEPYGRSLRLRDLHPEDLATIERIKAAGVPVVTVLVSGRPLIVNDELDASDSFVAAWLPGSEGDGVADGLFGRQAFGGRLPMPWPDRIDPLSPDSTYVARFEEGYGLSLGHSGGDSVDSDRGLDYKSQVRK